MNNKSVLDIRNDKNPLLKNIKITKNTNNPKSVLNKSKNIITPMRVNTETTEKPWYQSFFKGAEAFEDGKWNAGDLTKTVLNSAGDLGLNIIEGFAQVPEQIGTAIAGAEAQVADWLGFDEHANNVRKRIANNGGALVSGMAQKGQEALDANSVFDETSDSVANGIGQMLSYYVGSKVPIAGSNIKVGKLNVPTTALLSGTGGGLQEAYQNENIEDWQAWSKALGSGAVEGISEGIFGVLGVGGSELDDYLVSSLTKNIKNTIAKSAIKLGIKSSGEAAEEFISYAGNYLLDRVIDKATEISGKDNVKFSKEWNWDEVGEQMASAFLSTLITQGAGDVVANKSNKNNTKNNNIFSKQEINNALQKYTNSQNTETSPIYGKKQTNPLSTIFNEKIVQAKQNNTAEFNENKKYHISPNFSNEIDNVLNDNISSNTQVKARDYTPKILVNSGVKDLPMLITQKHIKSIIYTQEEAKKMGLPIKNVNYHGLGKEMLIKAIDGLDDPDSIYKINNEDYLVITQFKDNNNREIVVPIRIDGKGRYNNVFIDENQIKSVYGRNNLSNYIKNNNFELIYKKGTSDFNERIQYSNVADIPTNNSITQKNNYVKRENPLLTTFKNKVAENVYYNSADKYNIDVTNDTVKEIFRVANERGINIRYDSSVFTNSNQNAYWDVKKDGTREIILNPNANTGKALQSVIIHEMLHDMEGTKQYNDLAEVVLEYAKQQDEYEIALRDISNMYSNYYNVNSKNYMQKIESEMVADILGEKFGSQEFLNTLVKKNRTIMQKVHDWIINLLNKINKLTGYHFTKLYWSDVERKLKNAFKQEYARNNTESKLSVSKSTVDNKGRILSDQQQEFFKDSKVRDEKGNLLTVYHGTDKIFTEFRNKYIQHGRAITDGYYLTLDKTNASEYGSKIMELYANIKNPLYLHNYNGVIRELINRGYANSTDALIEKYNLETDDSGVVPTAKALTKLIKRLGYDGIITTTQNDDVIDTDWPATQIVVLNSNQIKNVDDLSPTNTKDVRYSKQHNNEWQSFLKQNFNNNGTKTTMKDVKLPKIKQFDIAIDSNNENNLYAIKSIQKKNSLSAVAPLQNEASYNSQSSNDNSITQNNNNVNDLHNLKEDTKKYSVSEEHSDSFNEEIKTIDKVLMQMPKEVKTEALNLKEKLYTELFDDLYIIDKISKETGVKGLYYIANNARQSRATADYIIGKNMTDLLGNNKGKSFKEIWENIPEENRQAFSDYLFNKHNEQRYARKKGVFGDKITAEQSLKIAEKYESEHPEFKEYAKDVYEYLDGLRNILVQGGLISKEQAKMLKEMYPYYVPTYRNKVATGAVSNFQNNISVKSQIKKATGSENNILPLQTMIPQLTVKYVNAARRNALYNTIYKLVKKYPEIMSKYAIEVKEKENSKKKIDAEVVDENLENTLKSSKENNDNGNILSLYQNGKKVKLKISNELYKALTSFDNNTYFTKDSTFIKIVNKLSNAKKSLITTYNPIFSITNFAKDFQDAIVYSNDAKKFAKKFPEAIKKMATNSKEWQMYQALGATQSGIFDREKGYKGDSKLPKRVIEKIADMNEFVEQIPRFSEFLNHIEKNGTDYNSLMEAMYKASDITVNFGRSGRVSRTADKLGAIYFNAAMQGADKAIRSIINNPQGNGNLRSDYIKGAVKTITKASLIAMVPALFNYLIYKDDEDYQELSDYQKDNYYLIKIGNKFLRIPKGRFWGGAFAATGVRTARVINGEKDAFKGLGTQIMDVAAPQNPLTNNLYSPIIDIANNKSWSGAEIIPKRLQNLEPKDQYDESTTSIAKWLGNKLNISPKQIDYVLQQNSGIIGQVLIPPLTPKAESNAISSKFIVDPVMSNKLATDFYDLKDELTKKKNSETLRKNLTEGFDTETSLLVSYLNREYSKINELNKEKRQIQSSELKNSEKSEKVREIQKQINDIYRRAVNNVNNNKGDLYIEYINNNDTGKVKEESMRLFNKYGEKEILPVPSEYKNITLYGTKINLTSSEKEKYNKIMINALDKLYSKIFNLNKYNNLSDENKIKLLDTYKGKLTTMVKEQMKPLILKRIIKDKETLSKIKEAYIEKKIGTK